ncbi:hypothetical protein DMUE_1698 [Dictyocoela muelleri]|nr:hypothetical protein DMUE_1698 [Dictyocoela muelleri]
MEHFIIQKWFQEHREDVQAQDMNIKQKPSKYLKKETHYQRPTHRRNDTRNLRKYCNVHKTDSHDNKECRAQLKAKNNEMKDKSKNFILNEARPPGKKIKIFITINESKIDAILDTGSDKNYLTANIINTLGLKPALMEKPEEVEIADEKKT